MIDAETTALAACCLEGLAGHECDALLVQGTMAIRFSPAVEPQVARPHRRRNREIDLDDKRIFAETAADIQADTRRMRAIERPPLTAPCPLIGRRAELPWRPREALPFAVPKEHSARDFATDDTPQTDATHAHGFMVSHFF
ncbi:MAG: hypothetical protein N2441_08320 [Rhodocyclaceae bacterium]|nr:hypothetical protein [Rhodocyclaceae bacterium]